MRIHTTTALTALGIAVMLGATSASAAVITTYTTRADFDLAVGSTTFEDFNGQTPGTSFIGAALDLGAFSIERTGSILAGQIEAGSAGFNIDGTTFGRVDTGSTIGDMIFTFDSPITAFGLDLDAWNDSVLRTTVEADGTSVPVTTQPGQDSRFFGFSSDMAFTEVRFIGGIGDSWGFDNLAFGGDGTAEVPVPGTLILAGLALAGLGFKGRRRR